MLFLFIKFFVLFHIFSCSNAFDYDIILRGGIVIDGTGKQGYKADIGIAKGKIKYIGPINKKGEIDLNISGKDKVIVNKNSCRLFSGHVFGYTLALLISKKIVEDFVNERDWSQFHNPKNLSMALAIEAGELMDIFKWNTTQECEGMMSEKNTRQDAADELADIMIYALAFSNRNNINISSAIEKKMIKNRKKYPAEKFKGHF